jgi:hypothetical protein
MEAIIGAVFVRELCIKDVFHLLYVFNFEFVEKAV